MKQKIILIAAIVTGLLAFWLTHQYIQGERARLFADAEPEAAHIGLQEAPLEQDLADEDEFPELAVILRTEAQLGGPVGEPGGFEAVLAAGHGVGKHHLAD